MVEFWIESSNMILENMSFMTLIGYIMIPCVTIVGMCYVLKYIMILQRRKCPDFIKALEEWIEEEK